MTIAGQILMILTGVAMEKSDDQLMFEVARGESEAFHFLFDRHAGKVLGYLRRLMGGNKVQAEDISQMVWMKVVRYAPQYKPQAKFTSWILTIARSSALTEMSATPILVGDEQIDDFALTQEYFESQIIEKEGRIRLREMIDELPEAQRKALVIWMTEDASYEDLSQILKLTIPAVKSLLFRAKQTLEKRIKESQ